MKITQPLAALVTLSLLGACAEGGGTRVDPPTREASFQLSEIRGAPLPVVVRGVPPDGSDAATVAAQMRTPASLGGRQMPLASPGSTEPRVVVAFAGASQTGLCAGQTTTAGPPGSGRMEATLAFCRGAQVVTMTRMSSGATAGPQDQNFARAMGQAIDVLLPDVQRGRGAGL